MGRRKLDLVGQRFGRLTVVSLDKIEKHNIFWNCICGCGKEKSINGSSLKSKKTQSCGCLQKERNYKAHFKDLTGKVFGRLTVIENKAENAPQKALWLCFCSCGNKTLSTSNLLNSGHKRSCGCLRSENVSKIVTKRNKEKCGENSPNWRGGISFEPYCPKFNKDLRKRIRSFFNNECVICGKTAEENRRQLSCHHVEYDKKACCDGKPVHFATLCTSCHAKTNQDRIRWESMLHRIINEIYEGKSYYTKEEYEKYLKNNSKRLV